MENNSLNYLYTPSTTILPPVVALADALPLEKISWEDFEKLCLAMAETRFSTDDCELYGIPGQKQHGLDIYARKTSGKYAVYQCKHYEEFDEADFKKAIEKFKNNKWANSSDEFCLCVSADLNRTELQEAFNKHRDELEKSGITFVKWDRLQINRILLQHPEIVYRFFGESWVKYFNGEAALSVIKKELPFDAQDLITLRKELQIFYSAVFNTYDTGMMLQDNKNFPLRERFIMPKVSLTEERNEYVAGTENPVQYRTYIITQEELNKFTYEEISKKRYGARTARPAPRRFEDVSHFIDDILTDGDRTVILGEPGSGKSTLLRFIIIDLLSASPELTKTARRWGKHIPVWIPFAFLTKNLSASPNLSVQDILKLWFSSYGMGALSGYVEKALADKRLIMFVDGLDEWNNLSAAGQAVSKIEVQSKLSGTKIVYSGRPYGFRFLQDSIGQIRRLTLSPLSGNQQAEFIFKWLDFWYRHFQDPAGSINTQDYISFKSKALYDEIVQSENLSQLSQYPLLLTILIIQKLQNAVLPANKISALEEITGYLINRHPRKRKEQANIIENDPSELNDFLEDIFSELALAILSSGSDGVILKSDAKKIVSDYLISALGFEKPRALLLSGRFIDIDASYIGLIAERSPEEISFIHRQFLEFLVAKKLNHSDREKAGYLLGINLYNPLWHQTILAFFGLIPNGREHEFMEYFNLIKSVEGPVRYADYKNLLLFEISLNLSNAPLQLSRLSLTSAKAAFAYGTSMILKNELLKIIMDGLNNVKIQEEVIRFVRQYVPNEYHFTDFRIQGLRVLQPAQLTDNMIDFLRQAFINGTTDDQLAASVTLNQFISDQRVFDFLVDICLHEPDFIMRAFAINALIHPDSSPSVLADILLKNASAQHPFLQLFCIKAKIFLQQHGEQDLKTFVSLQKHMVYEMRQEMLNVMTTGWPNSGELKEKCISSVKENYYLNQQIDDKLAWSYLFCCFNNDPEVIEIVRQEISTKEFPFVAMDDHRGWGQIAKYFKDCLELVPGIDEWILKQKYIGPETALACMVGHTDQIRDYFIDQLPAVHFSHWAVMALITAWPGDPAVHDALKKYFRSDNKNKSYAAHYISLVLKDDPEEAIKILENILFDHSFQFRERAIPDLILLDKGYFEKNILERFLGQELPGFTKDDFFNQYQSAFYPLAQHFYTEAGVQKILSEDPDSVFDYFSVIIQNESVSSPRVASLLSASLSIEQSLRLYMIKKLHPKIVSSGNVMALFKAYEQEKRDDVRFTMALHLFEHLRFTDEALVEKLVHDLVFAVGMNHETQRQIAFAGYLTIKKLDTYFKLTNKDLPQLASPGMSFYAGAKEPNADFVKLLSGNFEYLYSAVQGDLSRLSPESHVSKEAIVAFFAQYAGSSPSCHPFILDYITGNSDNIEGTVFLDFLNATSPQGNLLKKIAMRLVGRGNHDAVQIAAGKILGMNFSNDQEVKSLLLVPDAIGIGPGKMTALSLAWPDELILRETFDHMVRTQSPLLDASGFFLKFRFRDAENIMKFLDFAVNHENRFIEHRHFFAPLIKKVQDDSGLTILLTEGLSITTNMNCKISYYTLLVRTGNGNNAAEWKASELAKLNPLDHGYDIVANEIVSLMSVLTADFNY